MRRFDSRRRRWKTLMPFGGLSPKTTGTLPRSRVWRTRQLCIPGVSKDANGIQEAAPLRWD